MCRCGRPDGVREDEEAAALLASQPDIARLLTGRHMPLDDAAAAFALADDHTGGIVKMALRP